ncbi:MAG: hypothetical protein HY747_08430 [Elusimicrobia bacterium]|nr:hypothetical protein [Elusimicrobiota bacterium]
MKKSMVSVLFLALMLTTGQAQWANATGTRDSGEITVVVNCVQQGNCPESSAGNQPDEPRAPIHHPVRLSNACVFYWPQQAVAANVGGQAVEDVFCLRTQNYRPAWWRTKAQEVKKAAEGSVTLVQAVMMIDSAGSFSRNAHEALSTALRKYATEGRTNWGSETFETFNRRNGRLLEQLPLFQSQSAEIVNGLKETLKTIHNQQGVLFESVVRACNELPDVAENRIRGYRWHSFPEVSSYGVQGCVSSDLPPQRRQCFTSSLPELRITPYIGRVLRTCTGWGGYDFPVVNYLLSDDVKEQVKDGLVSIYEQGEELFDYLWVSEDQPEVEQE